jgi:hypothetical protein
VVFSFSPFGVRLKDGRYIKANIANAAAPKAPPAMMSSRLGLALNFAGTPRAVTLINDG